MSSLGRPYRYSGLPRGGLVADLVRVACGAAFVVSRGSFAPEARRWCRPTTLSRRIQSVRLDRHAVRCGFSVPEEHGWCNLWRKVAADHRRLHACSSVPAGRHTPAQQPVQPHPSHHMHARVTCSVSVAWQAE